MKTEGASWKRGERCTGGREERTVPPFGGAGPAAVVPATGRRGRIRLQGSCPRDRPQPTESDASRAARRSPCRVPAPPRGAAGGGGAGGGGGRAVLRGA